MKLKKWLVGVGVLCVVAVLIAFYTLVNSGWNWDLPQSLLSRIDFDQLTEKVDQLKADGYTDLSNMLTEESSYYLLGRADNENATPMIFVYWEKDRGDGAESSKVRYDANTKFVWDLDFSVGNKDRYRFEQQITIWPDRGRIWMVYYTKNLFAGRQQVIDYLSQFCDRYCTR